MLFPEKEIAHYAAIMKLHNFDISTFTKIYQVSGIKKKNPIRTPEKTKRDNQIDVVWILLGFSVALVAKLISDKNVCKETFVGLPETIS